eukprot:CAMPEP_0197256634 /NCGR_PEP_ID=MMETSP1429-20130617/76038_1 /TAXON_ID=49237 /ORGANISM="Chaetoceros  sp., Strain UNC1202" /LENGTH=42 /DNA_ID= /DNA_START= /DNA_END= /DNA_ORIENTATION=
MSAAEVFPVATRSWNAKGWSLGKDAMELVDVVFVELLELLKR